MTSYPEQRKPAVKKDLSQERLLLQGRRLMTRHVLNTPYTNFRPYASAFSMTFQAYTKLVSVKIRRLTCRKPDLSIERFTGLVYVCFQHFRLGSSTLLGLLQCEKLMYRCIFQNIQITVTLAQLSQMILALGIKLYADRL